APLLGRSARRPEADWLHGMGAPERRRAERDVSRAPVHGERGSTELRAPAADRRYDGTEQAARADSRRLSGARRARGDRELRPDRYHWITGRRRAFSWARLGGRVHSSRSAFAYSAWKNDAFMPPSMMSQGSAASRLRSRKM